MFYSIASILARGASWVAYLIYKPLLLTVSLSYTLLTPTIVIFVLGATYSASRRYLIKYWRRQCACPSAAFGILQNELWGTQYRPFIFQSLRLLEVDTFKQGLHIGCCGALVQKYYFKTASQKAHPSMVIHGLDHSDAVLDWCKSELSDEVSTGKAVFHRSNVIEQGLPFSDDSFEVIFAFDMIYLLPELSSMFREWIRCLKPGGKLILGFGPLHELVESDWYNLSILDGTRHTFSLSTVVGALESHGDVCVKHIQVDPEEDALQTKANTSLPEQPIEKGFSDSSRGLSSPVESINDENPSPRSTGAVKQKSEKQNGTNHGYLGSSSVHHMTQDGSVQAKNCVTDRKDSGFSGKSFSVEKVMDAGGEFGADVAYHVPLECSQRDANYTLVVLVKNV